MGRQAIYNAMCIRPEDEPSMTAFIASAGRRTYGKAIRDEAGALGYSLPATMPNDLHSLAAISDLAAYHAASIRAGYNPRLARAINALPDGITDDQVRHLLQPFIDSTRIYNTDTLYPLLNARLRALGIGHFYDRNGIKSQYRIMPDESDYDDDCQADIDLGIVDSLDDFSRTDYPWHPHCGHMGEPHMIVRVNIDPQTLPAPEELWDSTQGPIKSIIVIKEFDESQHPRDEHGRFSDSAGGSADGSADASHQLAAVAASRYDDARPYAQAALDKARAVEPQTTSDVRGIAEGHGGEMVGLDFRVKGEGSMTRKVADGALANDVTPEEEARQDCKDALRYTAIFDEGRLTQGTKDTMADLTSRGYERVAVKNTWKDGQVYKGINTNWRTPSGQVFEIQFHTTTSFDVKENINHPLYEKARLASTSLDQRAALERQMVANSDAIPTPPGVETIT